MEAARPRPASDAPAAASDAPTLPQAPARPAPSFERRDVVVVIPPRERHSSIRSYVIVAIGLVAVSVGGWFALSEYIYG